MCPYQIYIPKNDLLVPCGRCGICIKSHKTSWQIRLKEEMNSATSAYFITLTYAVSPPELIKSDFQKFMKRLRKNSKCGKIKYYAIGDYGDRFGRPHFHLLLYNYDQSLEWIEKSWKGGEFKLMSGFVKIDPMNFGNISYITNYVVNKTEWPLHDKRQKPFMLCSRGIGITYVDKMRDYHLQDISRTYYHDQGYRKAMPRYYKNKLYSEVKYLQQSKLRERMVRAQNKEILRLSKLSHQPVSEYWLRLENKSDAIIRSIEHQKKMKQLKPLSL